MVYECRIFWLYVSDDFLIVMEECVKSFAEPAATENVLDEFFFCILGYRRIPDYFVKDRLIGRAAVFLMDIYFCPIGIDI